MQKYARVLAPPRVLHSNLPPDPTIRANHAWLRGHRLAHRGQWVALRNGELLAAAPTLHELTERFDVSPTLLYTRVF
jgi:hypothetical protein